MNDNLEALLFLIRLPCLLLSRIFCPPKPKSSIQIRQDALERIEADEPTPLPKIRPRTLSLEDLRWRSNDNACLSGGAAEEMQRSIPPFFKLPLEVRRMIYTEVLGGQTLHILRKHKRLGFLRCSASRPEDFPAVSCYGCVGGDGVWTRGWSGKERTDGGLLDLPLVSRRFYTETITFLYAANEFCLTSLLTLFSLQRTLVPHRLAAITSLVLDCHILYPFYLPAPYVMHQLPPHDEATWEDFWQIVRVNMRGLKKVAVRVWHVGMGLEGEAEHMMLAPLRAIAVERGLKITITLPWKGKEDGGLAEGLIVTRKTT